MCAQRADSYNGRTDIGTDGQDNFLKRSLRAKKIKIRENYIQNIYKIFTKYIQNIEKIYTINYRVGFNMWKGSFWRSSSNGHVTIQGKFPKKYIHEWFINSLAQSVMNRDVMKQQMNNYVIVRVKVRRQNWQLHVCSSMMVMSVSKNKTRWFFVGIITH